RSLYLNLAMAHLKCHEPREALRALKCILLGGEDEPEIMLKTLYRMALCHKELGEWDDFDRCARAMLEADGESVLAKRLIQEATSLRARDSAASSKLAKHMFSGFGAWSEGRARTVGQEDTGGPGDVGVRCEVASQAAAMARERAKCHGRFGRQSENLYVRISDSH
ncbi:hypothetical protein FOZ62_029939, partial [Perkinsus olseni]